MRLAHLLLTAAVGVTLAACGADEPAPTASAYDVVAEAQLQPGDEVPVPTGDVVLTITGDIATTNDGDALVLDMATLESLRLVSYTVDDNQALGRDVEFTGVLLADLLEVAGAAEEASTLETVALNDYSVEIPAEDASEYPVLLATQADGERMPVEDYGPVRVVYPTHAFELDPTVFDPRWIWQLRDIDVR